MDYVTFNGEKFNLPQKEYNGKYMGQMDQYKRAATYTATKKANHEFIHDSPRVEYSGLEPLTSTLPVLRSTR